MNGVGWGGAVEHGAVKTLPELATTPTEVMLPASPVHARATAVEQAMVSEPNL